VSGLFDTGSASDVQLLWVTDVDHGGDLTEARARRLDAVIALSDWHRDHLVATYPWLEPLLHVIPMGVHREWYSGPSLPRHPRVVHTSAPERGLDVLFSLWPEVRERVPDAQLTFCHADVYDARARRTPALADFYAEVTGLSRQPGVAFLGALDQRALARLLRRSRVWMTASYDTGSGEAFRETSCIAAVEAQAAGCVAVASAWGALPETVRVGRLIDEVPGSERWRSGLRDALVAGLTDPELQAEAQHRGPAAVAELDWTRVADAHWALIERCSIEAGA
jgi:glycosyltransferase involved in cell wall biosynthesis